MVLVVESSLYVDVEVLTFRLEAWSFYMIFSLFICPSVGRLVGLVGMAISTKVLSQEL